MQSPVEEKKKCLVEGCSSPTKCNCAENSVLKYFNHSF